MLEQEKSGLLAIQRIGPNNEEFSQGSLATAPAFAPLAGLDEAPEFAPICPSAAPFAPFGHSEPTTADPVVEAKQGGWKVGAVFRQSEEDGHTILLPFNADAPCIGWGCQSGDILLAINDIRMDDYRMACRTIDDMPWGAPIRLTVMRNGRLVSIVGAIGQ